MVAACLNNALRRHGIQRTATAIVTSVEVDANDPALREPTKPIGNVCRRDKALKLQQEEGWQMAYVPRQGWRRVVPSPSPRAVVELDLIRRLTDAGELLVVAGGGGIPVTRDAAGDLHGVEAVIDKDRTAALIGRVLDAPVLLIVTSVERVALDYGTEHERALDRLTVSEAGRYLAAGSFRPAPWDRKSRRQLSSYGIAEPRTRASSSPTSSTWPTLWPSRRHYDRTGCVDRSRGRRVATGGRASRRAAVRQEAWSSRWMRDHCRDGSSIESGIFRRTATETHHGCQPETNSLADGFLGALNAWSTLCAWFA